MLWLKMCISVSINSAVNAQRSVELKWRCMLCQLTFIKGYSVGTMYDMRILNTCAKNVLLKVLLTICAISTVSVGLFFAPKALANELTIDIGYQDDIALDVRYRVKSGLFLTSSAHKDVQKAGIGYGLLLDDFFLLASYDSEETGTIYGSYKPRKAHWQVGLRLEESKTDGRAEIEYTYLFQDSVGIVGKVDSNGDWFLGFRKWL